MRKFIKAGICMAAAAMVLSGCKSETGENTAGQGTESAEISEEELTDEASITIGNYKGLELTRTKAEVTDEELENQLEYIAYIYPEEEEVTGRAAQEGDTANIDYSGTKDGELFEGGSDVGYDLELGSGSFIEGFEEGIVGMEIGEEKDLNLTFPDPYENSPDLAGQEVVFHVKLNGLKLVKTAELNDDLAKRALGEEDATLEDLKTQVYDNLLTQKERDAFYNTGNQALLQIVDNSEITCDPDAIDDMYNQLQQTYTVYAFQYGTDLDTFLNDFLGMDLDGLKENAEVLVKQQMVLDEVVRLENLKATDEQKEAFAAVNNFESADELIQTYGEESAEELFTMEAAYQFLIDNANVTEVDETEAAADTESSEAE